MNKRFFIILTVQGILMVFFLIFSIVQKQEAEGQRMIATQNNIAATKEKETSDKIILELKEALKNCSEK